MSEAYQFAIGRSRALILAACFAAAALLVFFAGTLTGILYSNSHETSAKVTVPGSAVRAPKAPEVKAPELAAAATTNANPATPAGTAPPVTSPGDTAKATSQTLPPATATSAAAPTASTVPVLTTAPAAATAANVPPASGTSAAIATPPPSVSAMATTAKPQSDRPSTNDKPSATPVEASYAIPLVVRVGSFTVKANAESLMQSLKDMGYQPAMSLYTDSKGRDWYAVKLGPYTRWNIASQVAARVSIAENVTPVIGPMQ